jgi:cyclase
MLRPRVIPVLTLQGSSLVKTTRFADPQYLGDPINALRIFNTKEVDELVILDITATRESRAPDVRFLRELTSECFMPVAFGGGIASLAVAEAVLGVGVEKVVVNSAAVTDQNLVRALAVGLGSQAVVVSIDVKRGRLGRHRVTSSSGAVKSQGADPCAWAREMEVCGAGEILLTSVDRDGTAEGYDLPLVQRVADAVDVPVVACGGAGNFDDLRAVLEAGAAAAGAGRMFVTHGKHRASLVSYLTTSQIEALD